MNIIQCRPSDRALCRQVIQPRLRSLFTSQSLHGIHLRSPPGRDKSRSESHRLQEKRAGGLPSGENMGKVFALSAVQGGRPVPVRIDYDKIVWSGMTWAVGEIDPAELTRGEPA